MKPPLLFLCHRIPYPPNKGDKIRSFHLLRHLSLHFDIYLATFVDDPEDWAWVSEVEKYCTDTLFVSLNPSIARVRSLSGLLTGKVLSLPYYSDSRVQAWVRSSVAEHKITRILVYSAAMAQYVIDPALSFERKVVDFVDIDSDKWLQYSMQKRWPMSWLYRREGKLLLEFERKIANLFDSSLFVSSAEADMFRTLAPESAEKVGFFNNGVNTTYFCPNEELPNPYEDHERVMVFTGAMDYWPNVDAVTWFAQEIFPEMQSREPNLRFYIVGSSPSKSVTQLARMPGIIVTGRVVDMRPYLQHAQVAVAPMRVARGVQNKVLEAMAMEKPVIVTGKGLEGIDAAHAEHVLLAESVAEYSSALQQVLAGDWQGLGGAARKRISGHFNWDENLPEVVYLLADKPFQDVEEKAFA